MRFSDHDRFRYSDRKIGVITLWKQNIRNKQQNDNK